MRASRPKGAVGQAPCCCSDGGGARASLRARASTSRTTAVRCGAAAAARARSSPAQPASKSSSWGTLQWASQSESEARVAKRRRELVSVGPAEDGQPLGAHTHTRRLVERFLLDNYKPHTLSTYALTLYRYNFTDDGGKTTPVGQCAAPRGCCSRRRLGQEEEGEGHRTMGTRSCCWTRAHCGQARGSRRAHLPSERRRRRSPRAARRACACACLRRHLGHGGPGALQQHARQLLLPGARLHHGV